MSASLVLQFWRVEGISLLGMYPVETKMAQGRSFYFEACTVGAKAATIKGRCLIWVKD